MDHAHLEKKKEQVEKLEVCGEAGGTGKGVT